MSIKKIVTDIIDHDPLLKEHKKDVEVLVKELLATKDDIKIDKRFVKRMKKELKKEVNKELSNRQTMKHPLIPFTSGIALAAIAATLFVNIWQPNTKAPAIPVMIDAITIDMADEESFGKLEVEESQGHGGGAEMAMMADSRIAMPGIVPPGYGYERINYEYIYKGEDINLENEKLQVLKAKKVESSVKAPGLLNQIAGKLINTKMAADADVTHVNYVQDKEFGYSVSANAADGSVSINQNYEKWPNIYEECKYDQKCIQENKLTESDILSDSELIEIAKEFVMQWGINTDLLGDPEVQSSPMTIFKESQERSIDPYVPEMAQVFFPYKINDMAVVNQGGYKEGMLVSVNMRYKKASGAYGMRAFAFDGSMYEAQTSAEEFKREMMQGGWGVSLHNNPDKIVELAVANPQMVLMKTYRSNKEERGMNDEFYVPAMQFDIKKPDADDEAYKDIALPYRDTIVVPLIKEFTGKKSMRIPLPEIMELPVKAFH